jgi:serine/threonine-protein kinase RIO1
MGAKSSSSKSKSSTAKEQKEKDSSDKKVEEEVFDGHKLLFLGCAESGRTALNRVLTK